MHNCKILLVDDDSEDRTIIKTAMDMVDAGEVLYFAENGEHAVELLDGEYTSDRYRPRLIVLDLNMPRMNGTETLRHLKNDDRFNNIPVIIFSTSINPIEQKKCMALGAHSYITKPVSYTECIETAKTFLSFCD